MRRIYTAETITQVEFVRALLAAQGIHAELRNQYLSSGLGELPAFETWPELWLADDAQIEQARVLIDEITEQAQDSMASWRCRACDERIEGQFGQCWSCGEVRDESGS